MTSSVFDGRGPLPEGITLLEASAGTGKTSTIAALAVRYVASGLLPLDRLLVVTFTRMATGELRERVRDRLVITEAGLARPDRLVSDDPLVALLAAGDPDEVERRRLRLAAALADFDAATIATTHGFCQHVLTGLGVAGDVESEVTFVEQADDLRREVVEDLYLRKFYRRGDVAFTLAEAQRVSRMAVENPSAHIEPVEDGREDRVLRGRLATAVRAELDERKRALQLITYDDLLTRLAETLRDPVRGPGAVARLRQRYQVALVDEFQDTDPIQWEIMHRAFGGPDNTLVLIGDPKQAIYAFRGADVYAYLEAAGTATTTATLDVNWRSDAGLLDAFDALWLVPETGAPARLGHEDIVYRPVQAPPANQQPRLVDAPVTTPLRFRVVHREHLPETGLTPTGYVKVGTGRALVARDLAAEIVEVLTSEARLIDRDDDGGELARRPVVPSDLAVLVRTNNQARIVRHALSACGVPSVVNGAGSVLASPAATDWRVLLEALERPSSTVRVRAAAMTSFIGWDAVRVAETDDREWELVHALLHRWASVLRHRGVASLLELLTKVEHLPKRILARADGERLLTDLHHMGQLLHAEMSASQLGTTALTAWLREQIETVDDELLTEDRSRRLESDADAVQVLTVHRSKGLEFPIVYFPFLWDPPWFDKDKPPIFHDPDFDDRRTIDVAMSGATYARHQKQALEEDRGEDLRLLYVALTRARHQAVAWWASAKSSGDTALGRLLFARDEDGTVDPYGPSSIEEDELVAVLTGLEGASPGNIAVEHVPAGDRAARWERATVDPDELQVSSFARTLDEHWRRTSYSGITADVHEAPVASESEDFGVIDEDVEVEPGVALASSLAEHEQVWRDTPSPLAAMPGGADVGSLVHAVFEHTDFAASDLDLELRRRLIEEEWRRLDLGDPEMVVAGLRAAIETPLGPIVGGARLRDIGSADRLDELDFELPLAGGDRPEGDLSVLTIASLLDGALSPTDPLFGYGDRLRDPALEQELRGYLVGSIDCVLRTTRPDGAPRFTIVDYKTNWLGGDLQALTAWDYRPEAMADAMQRAHYPLQAIIYSVALHRYLRWRLSGYDPAVHLGGALYLFVRGMTGADATTVDGAATGVFAWEPPPSLVVALSDAFDRGGGA